MLISLLHTPDHRGSTVTGQPNPTKSNLSNPNPLSVANLLGSVALDGKIDKVLNLLLWRRGGATVQGWSELWLRKI